MPLHETQSHFLQIEQPTEDVERKLRTLILEKLGIEQKIEIGNVHRFGKRYNDRPRPIQALWSGSWLESVIYWCFPTLSWIPRHECAGVNIPFFHFGFDLHLRIDLRVTIVVFNTIFDNISVLLWQSVILWQSVLLEEETGVPGETILIPDFCQLQSKLFMIIIYYRTASMV
jgi:hypothetical protein